MIEEIKIEKDKTPKTTPNKPILDVDHKNGKKKYYKPRKKREILDIEIDKIGLNNFHKIYFIRFCGDCWCLRRLSLRKLN